MTDPEELLTALDGLVHAETQVGDRGVDLTVAAVYEHDGPGRVDFGGGELEPASLTPHDRQLRNPDDDYVWWHLEPGGYLFEYNERLVGDGAYRVQTRDAVRERGAFHPALVVDSLGRMPLFVGDGGLRLKENARISTLLPGPT
ncbi:MAG: dCTP deaminase [Halobacteriales archaeon]